MLRVASLACLTAVVLALAGCSSEADADAPYTRVGEIRASEVWKDGLVLTGSVTIYPGAEVEIAPGATITCAEGASILVGGMLRTKSAGARARITCGSWLGVLVAQGGRLDLEGLELENAKAGITTTEGAGESRFVDGAVLRTLKPFVVGAKSKLTVSNAKVTTPEKVGDAEISLTEISGSLVASRLDYDAGANEGLMVKAGGELDLEDSHVHGTNGLDMVSAYEAKRLRVAYSILSGSHCGAHIQGIESFELDHVTSEKNTYGMTIYGSGAGPNLVRDSNLEGAAAWLDFQGQNGPVSFENVHTKGGEIIDTRQSAPPTISGKAQAPIPNAKPR